MSKTWFITGASRGLGVEIARVALNRGDQVFATGRDRGAVTTAVGPESDRLAAFALDVTDDAQVKASVGAAVSRFGRIDVLVNNAGYGQMGLFEEMTIADAEAQFATNLYGVFRVTWAALPHMRSSRSGRIFNISSLAGILGAQMASFYCATKFALEGFSESLAKEIAPFGISVTLVEPGPFRTDFLAPQSIRFAGRTIADYDDLRSQVRESFEQRNGHQPGDPHGLAVAIIHLANQDHPPLRFLAGAVAVNAAVEKLNGMQEEIATWREWSLATDGTFRDTNVEGFLSRIK